MNISNDAKNQKGKSNNLLIKFKVSKSFIQKLNYFLKIFRNIIGEKFENDAYTFYKKYSNKICLNRFSIGIFGKISSGKSTFYNYLLGLKDILEFKSDIATKFIAIIRHNKNNKYPKFYEVKFEKRKGINGKEAYFNYEKGDEIEGDINEIISKRNEDIIRTEKDEEKTNEYKKYFLIVEANLTLFNDPFLEKYSEFFEFMDIPGLNESNMNENLYSNFLIPIIIPNISFCIFLLDIATSIEDNATYNIVKNITLTHIEKIYDGYLLENVINKKELSDYLSKEIVRNSLYIINKVDDGRNDKIAYIQIIKDKISKIYKNKNYFNNPEELNIIPLSARNLLYEEYRFDDFFFFLGHTLAQYNKLDKKCRKEFKSYLSNQLNEINENKNIENDKSNDSSDESEEDENLEIQFNSLNNKDKTKIKELISDVKNICVNFDIKKYFKYKKNFHPKTKKKNK